MLSIGQDAVGGASIVDKFSERGKIAQEQNRTKTKKSRAVPFRFMCTVTLLNLAS
jgi:hypothetical protein